MSNEILNNVWKFAPAKDAELVILLALADQANDEGICWPGLKSLMARSRASRPTVYRSVKSLEEKGIITEIRRGEEGFPPGKFTSRVWRVNPVEEWEPLMSDGDEVSQFETEPKRGVSWVRQQSLMGETRTPKEPPYLKSPSDSYGARAVKDPEKWGSKDLAEYFRAQTMVYARTIKTGNMAIMTKFFSTQIKAGFSPAELKIMVDIFFKNWEGFKVPGMEVWRIFLANGAIIQDKAHTKHLASLADSGGEAYWLGI